MPFLLQPNEHRSGTLHPYTAGTEMYFYHHQSEYRPVEVAVRKVNEKSPNVVMYIATYPHPDKENHQWVDTTDADGRADITIEEGYPWYCTDCFYYVSVFFMDSEAEQDNTAIEIEYNCPDSMCKVCKNGFDPSTDCKECLPGFYGKDCKACKNCNHGTCDSGISGTGKCVCNEGWGPEEVCTSCLEGFWGDQCQKCPSCHSHGKCNDGLKGDGTCTCEGNWDSRVNCDDCKDGFFGLSCEGQCPATTNGVCDNNGDCNDKRTGDGHCVCNAGMVGINCDTKLEDDKCKPHCIEGHGACDETQGKCQCWGDYNGSDCKYEKKNMWITLLIASTVILLIVLAIVMISRLAHHTPRRNRKEKKPLVADAENGYKSMD